MSNENKCFQFYMLTSQASPFAYHSHKNILFQKMLIKWNWEGKCELSKYLDMIFDLKFSLVNKLQIHYWKHNPYMPNFLVCTILTMPHWLTWRYAWWLNYQACNFLPLYMYMIRINVLLRGQFTCLQNKL